MSLLQLLPQNHRREGCQLTARVFQHPEFDVRDLLDGARVMKNWDVIKLLPGNCRGACVDACGQGKDVLRLNNVRVVTRPDMCQVKNLKRKSTGLRRANMGKHEIIRQKVSALLLVG